MPSALLDARDSKLYKPPSIKQKRLIHANTIDANQTFKALTKEPGPVATPARKGNGVVCGARAAGAGLGPGARPEAFGCRHPGGVQ